jgi:membrane associated rhomboid family serine protease
MSSSSSSGQSRIQEFILRTPFFTLSLLIFNVAIHAVVFLFSVDISSYVFQPFRIWYMNEYYRMITSAFLHGGIFHIGMNMMSLVAIGGMLEPAYGSIKFLWITWMSLLLGGACYMIMAG